MVVDQVVEADDGGDGGQVDLLLVGPGKAEDGVVAEAVGEDEGVETLVAGQLVVAAARQTVVTVDEVAAVSRGS